MCAVMFPPQCVMLATGVRMVMQDAEGDTLLAFVDGTAMRRNFGHLVDVKTEEDIRRVMSTIQTGAN